MSEPPPPLPRTIDDRYEVTGVLGEGGTGIVYDAIAPDGAHVAVKVMHAALAGDEQIRGRFKREAAILARLKGKHVCPILEAGETVDSLLFLVLPRIDGPSLASVIAKERLAVPRAIEIMAGVASALAAAHAEGIIHRDLKPANVLLDGGEKVVVVDFGLSKIVIGGGAGTTNLTKHNMLFGTPEYMSPEQARGDELDGRTDVYAAGAMLYELLTGAPPFTGDTPLVVLTAQLTSDIVPPAGAPPAITAVTLHALARDREKRYPTAAALRGALLRARDEPENAERVTPEAIAAEGATLPASAPTPPPVALGPTPPLGLAPTLVATRPSNAPPSRRSTPPPSRRPPPPRPVDPSMRAWILAWIVVGAASIATGVWLALRG